MRLGCVPAGGSVTYLDMAKKGIDYSKWDKIDDSDDDDKACAGRTSFIAMLIVKIVTLLPLACFSGSSTGSSTRGPAGGCQREEASSCRGMDG